MPNIFQIKDAHQIMRSLAMQATGRQDITVVNHADFINAGRDTFATGYDNVLESIAMMVKDVFIIGRPYEGKFKLTTKMSNEPFNPNFGKIHFYTKYNEAEGGFNTDLYTNIKDGYDNGTNGGQSAPNMWVQNMPKVIEQFFYSSAAWQKRVTIPIAQMQRAFDDEGTFVRFMNVYAINVQNEINTYIENEARALVASRIAGVKYLVDNGILGPECAVDMTAYFQDETNQNYTDEEILKEHQTEFLELFMSKWKIDSNRLEEESAFYHDSRKITEDGVDYWILDHTPKSAQRMYYTSEIFDKAKARVLPTIFGPDFIPANQGEAVGFWQSNKEGERYKIVAKPAIPNQPVEELDTVEIDNVLGIIFDEEALLTQIQFEAMYSSPIEAAKLYKNDIYHFMKGHYSDYLCNSIIYYMSKYGKYENVDEFTGDGTEDDFVLTKTVKEILKVTVDGTAKTEGTDYTFDSDTNTITFTTAPANKKKVVVDYVWTD